MHSHSIKDLLDLPELNVRTIQKEQDQVLIEVTPIDATQPCPVCASTQTIRRGTAYQRKVRHLAAFGKRVYLLLPAIRLTCKDCHAHFVWHYDCVAPKKRYTKAFETTLPKQAIGATITHAARLSETPPTTVHRVVRQWMATESVRVQSRCAQQAKARTGLVLGIDDFAIRKGHRYNTGLHDLRGGTFLDVIPGRTIAELQDYYQEQPIWQTLNPIAVVMDLAQGYHTFIKEMYPNAIRIADRFHVNRYVTDALQNMRKHVQKSLSPFAKADLKQHFRILGKRHDQLTNDERVILNRLLGYAPLLRQVYEWKEAFIVWYDCSPTYVIAQKSYKRWLAQGKAIGHPIVDTCLKTMHNWREEICNYHQLRFTNAAVEGKNNKIKALQRRHYFTRNPESYKQHILLECNEEWIQYGS